MIEVLKEELECKKIELEIIELSIKIKKKTEELKNIEYKENITNRVSQLGYYPMDSILVEYREKLKIKLLNNVIDVQRKDNRLCLLNKKLRKQTNLVEIDNETKENVIILKIENKENVDVNSSVEGNLAVPDNPIINVNFKASKIQKKIYDNNGIRMTIQRILKGTKDKIFLNKRKAKLIVFLEKDKDIVSEYVNIKFQDIII